MKKAKIMLMGIAVFGIVGGAFAFKASKFFGHVALICTTTQAGQDPTCTTTAGFTSVPILNQQNGDLTFITSFTTDPGVADVCTYDYTTANQVPVYCETADLTAYNDAGE